MRITPIRILNNNYSYILQCMKTNLIAIIDPAEPVKVFQALHGSVPQILLTTHHHPDHAQGNLVMKERYPGLQVYAGDHRVLGIDVCLEDRNNFQFGSLKITPIFTPGHTIGSVCYLVLDSETRESALFTGDTLFVGGCGRFFEGTAQDMYISLIQTIGKLPKDTLIYCGHEYTKANLDFGHHIEPGNRSITERLANLEDCNVPSTIGIEFDINVFMRVHDKALQRRLGISDPVELLARLRQLKNDFCL